ncbi:hypothetical protein M1247_29785 [Mycobacterium sp. 21AC1]|nr:hypothetical protein [Mycobacterium sp. 21AC1]MDV3129128.1 hypothetical protein [Mycobacterium sp. 21AC1]
MNQMVEVLILMAVPAAVLMTLRYVVKRQERRAPTVVSDTIAPPGRSHD